MHGGTPQLSDNGNEVDLAVETLRELLSYDSAAGTLTWRNRPLGFCKSSADATSWNKKYAGKPAFTARKDGYRHGSVFRKTLRAHRVCWALYYGAWPVGDVDHIDHDRSNNRIENLRDVTRAENRRNQTLLPRNKSGFNGVCWYKPTQKWCAYIRVRGKAKNLGYFENFDDAVAVRIAANREFGFHQNHGAPEGSIKFFADPRQPGGDGLALVGLHGGMPLDVSSHNEAFS